MTLENKIKVLFQFRAALTHRQFHTDKERHEKTLKSLLKRKSKIKKKNTHDEGGRNYNLRFFGFHVAPRSRAY